MEVILIATGLTNMGEHSYRLVREVSRALTRRNVPQRAYAAKSLHSSIANETFIRPHFERSLYEHVGPLFSELQPQKPQVLCNADMLTRLAHTEFRTWKTLNRSFRRDLEALPNDACTAENLMVITAISQNQICGLIDFLLARPPHLQPRVVCQLMFTPTWTPWGRPAHRGASYYRKAFRRAAPLIGRKLFFTAENEGIAKLYRDRYDVEIGFLPVAIGAAQPQRNAETIIRIGFFGYSKCEKGFQLLPEIITLCQEKKLAVTFAVQIQHSGWERETIASDQTLRGLNNIRLIEGALSSEDYIAETNQIDVALLPYDPVLFGLRGSGVFTEAIAAGRPIIVSDGTFAAESIKKGEAQGEIFAPYTAQACVAAIARLLPRMSECKARAAAQAETFARTHDAEAYADALLKFAAR